jgi:16S rRNA (guanine966-N2)-methyltransferase
VGERTSTVRIIGGTLRGRRIRVPAAAAVRPTTDRVREATFNSLMSQHLDRSTLVVDLFAGSGALGIEALSRGFERAVFVEQHRPTAEALKQTLAALGLADRSEVVVGDSMAMLGRSPVAGAGVALCDPPYEFDRWAELLRAVDAGLVVIESPISGEDLAATTDRFELVRTKKYGRAWVTFLGLVGYNSFH